MHKSIKIAAVFTFGIMIAYSVVNKKSKGNNLQAIPSKNQKQVKALLSFPQSLDPQCRDGIANIYDECGNQQLILDQALKAAQEADKRVLILYGAEWCIWCHVFDKYVKGQNRKFDYQWQYHDGEILDWEMLEKENLRAEEEAIQLNHYFDKHFVLTHIESYYSDSGEQVLADLGYDVSNINSVPLVLVLDSSGQISGEMQSSEELIGLEKRQDSGEEFRGYDRKLLLAELQRLFETTNVKNEA